MKGIILHGGFGTRLRPLTHTGPKQLIPVAGKPISQWAIEDLRDSGITNIGIILGELSPLRVIEVYGDGHSLGVNLTYIYQGFPYGLAHAVYIAKEFVEDDAFVVYLGDNILAGGISKYVKKFEESNSDAMVLLAEVDNPSRFGVAQFDEKGRLVRLIEKPQKPPSNYALVGVYFFRDDKIFNIIEKLKPSWRGELEITDAIQKMLELGYKVDYDIVTGWWKDTGTYKDVIEVNRLLLDKKFTKNVIKGKVSDSARIEGRVYIDEGVVIGENSIIRGPTYIGKNTKIENDVYIGPYTSIGSNCTLRNLEIENSIVMDNVKIENIQERITDSLIGSNILITAQKRKPIGHRFIIGENSIIIL